MSNLLVRLPIDIEFLAKENAKLTIKHLSLFAMALGGRLHQPMVSGESLSVELIIDYEAFVAARVEGVLSGESIDTPLPSNARTR